MEEPAAYGKLGLANLLELREECLREFQFVDAYRSIKQRCRYCFFLYVTILSKLCSSLEITASFVIYGGSEHFTYLLLTKY